MKTIRIANYSFKPPKELAYVTLTDDGKIELRGEMAPQLEKGVYHYKTRGLIFPAQGEQFYRAVLQEFNGSYVRATEGTLSAA